MQKKIVTLNDKIWKNLKKVMDPELGISLVEMGLIYDVRVVKKTARITMTLTTIGCPLFSIIENDIKSAVLSVSGVSHVSVNLTFDPPWSMDKMSENAIAQLGI